MKYHKVIVFICIAFFVLSLLIAPAFAKDKKSKGEKKLDAGKKSVEVSDPIESYNRFMFKFNDAVYNVIFNPVSDIYSFLLPEVVQGSVDNFFSNIGMPVRFFNNIFQTKFEKASTEVGRFLINSTVGLGGLFDPAKSKFNLKTFSEDFGQTLGHYGMDTGPYIVLPILGPSNVRDTIGYIADVPMDPLFWLGVSDTDPEEVYTWLPVLEYVNNYSYNLRDHYEGIVEGAIEPYVALRNAYIQNRRKKVKE